jgi:hypothetical protein
MYVDKPMKGHNLMQAIARVNRVFHDKPGGLVVDYIGIATELKDALATYTKGKKEAPPVEFIEEALGVFFEILVTPALHFRSPIDPIQILDVVYGHVMLLGLGSFSKKLNADLCPIATQHEGLSILQVYRASSKDNCTAEY